MKHIAIIAGAGALASAAFGQPLPTERYLPLDVAIEAATAALAAGAVRTVLVRESDVMSFGTVLDDARAAVTYDRMVPPASFADYRKWLEHQIEVLNHAIEGIPAERIRYHVCWGSWPGPHTTDVPLQDIVDILMKANVGAFLIEGANPRHEHEWIVWRDTVKLPDDKVLITGILNTRTNYVEHPELVAQRINRYARTVGKERVIAGADCGFSSRASYHPEVHPTVVVEKFKALAQGAAIATDRLW